MVMVEEGEVDMDTVCLYLLSVEGIYVVCVCGACLRVCRHIYIWGHTESRMSGVFLCHSLSYSPETGSLTELEACAGRSAGSSPQELDCKDAEPRLTFYMALRI